MSLPSSLWVDELSKSTMRGRGVAAATRAERHRLPLVRCCRRKEGSRGPDGAARDSRKFRKSQRFSLGAPGDSGGGESSLGAPKSGPPGEPTKSRSRRQKLSGRPAARRFVYPGPVLLLPSLDGRFVPHQSSAFGLLRGPVEPMQEFSGAVVMAGFVESLLNHLSHSLRGPQFCAVAIGDGSSKQDPDQPLLLAWGESSRTTWRESHLEGIRAASSPRIPPAHHGTGGALDTPSNFVQGQFLAKEFQCTSASIRKQLGRTLGSHRDLLSPGGLLYCIILCDVYRKIFLLSLRRL